MIAMPMRAVLDRHVEPDQDNALRVKLRDDVEQLEAAVTGTANFPGFFHQQVVAVRRGFYTMHMLEKRGGVAALAHARTCKIRHAIVHLPPSAIASI